jgi:hypothetical protein
MGDIVLLHRCDECSELIDGGPYFYWSDKDFSICLNCIEALAKKVVPTMPESQKSHNKKAVIPSSFKWNVFERDNFTCQYCGTRRNLSIDHIIPEAAGGSLELNNAVTACNACNTAKGSRTPEEAGMKLLNDPRGR